ncbi:MAG TPA: hypothetical protein VF817_00590 [Patescibacteria group bacterium]
MAAKTKRKIDKLAEKHYAKLGKKFTLVKKGKLWKLKAFILIAFTLGSVIAIVWGFSSGNYNGSDAAMIKNKGVRNKGFSVAMDTTKPIVVSFNLSPESNSLIIPVDISAKDDIGVVAWMIKETASDFSPVAPRSGDSGWQTAGITGKTAVNIRGNITASSLGRKYFWVYVKDAAGNVSVSFNSSVVTIADKNAPRVTAFSITPTLVNTTSQDQILTMNATIDEDISGVCLKSDNCGTWTSLRIKNVTTGKALGFDEVKRISGDLNNGTYTASLKMRKGSALGAWSVQDFVVTDKAGNRKTYSYGDLKSVPNVTGLDIMNNAQ